jgi:hypothetical protein
MKVVEVAQVLAVIVKIYQEAGNRGTADGILTFAELLQDNKDRTVTTFVGRVKKELSQRQEHPDSRGTADANAIERQGAADAVRISEIRAVLDKLRLIYISSGAKSQAGDCEKLSEVLGARGDEFVGSFVKTLRNALTKEKRNVVNQAGTDGADVGKYASMLLAAGTNELAFNPIFSAIKSDRGVTKPILDAIANRYLNEPTGSNHVYKFKTKTHAFDAIRNKFFERAQAKSKGDIINRLMSGS